MYEIAEKLYKECLDRRVQVLGLEHRDTLLSIGNLAVLYDAAKKTELAREQYEELVRIHKMINPNSKETMEALDTLGR